MSLPMDRLTYGATAPVLDCGSREFCRVISGDIRRLGDCRSGGISFGIRFLLLPGLAVSLDLCCICDDLRGMIAGWTTVVPENSFYSRNQRVGRIAERGKFHLLEG